MSGRELGKYPEHDKLHAVDRAEKRGVTNFLEWLGEHEYEIHSSAGCGGWDCGKGIEELLGEFFEIDREALEREKLQMIEELRRLHDQPLNSQDLMKTDHWE